jgi:hypothetical protein
MSSQKIELSHMPGRFQLERLQDPAVWTYVDSYLLESRVRHWGSRVLGCHNDFLSWCLVCSRQEGYSAHVILRRLDSVWKALCV